MRLKYRIGKTWMILICAAVIAAPLVGCGTILYPERRGQSAMGRLDVDIVILDGLGLFFFLVPGVIAFAVDFATGAIYLPRGHKSKASELLGELELREERLTVRSVAEIERILREATGLTIELEAPSVLVFRAPERADVSSRLRELNAGSPEAVQMGLTSLRPGFRSAS
ncbi:MAG: hypothetical protein O7B23_13550 [Deltaproteobacteria bacterium]|nr:hypothetical protein [Deltaproteobacteria bacterium]